MTTATEQLSPARIFAMANSHQVSQALKTAIEIEIFTAVDDGAHSDAEIAAACSASKRGVRILCDFLTIQGILRKDSDGYHLTPESAQFLSKRSPAYIGGVTGFLLHPAQLRAFENLTAAVRSGSAAPRDCSIDSSDGSMWVAFARGMQPLMQMPARFTAQAIGPLDEGASVLDIAAGHGMFGIEMARMNPGTQVSGLDSPDVIAIARENAAKFGVGERYTGIPGDAFTTDLGGPYDVALLPNFAHSFGPAQNTQLLQRLHSALKPGGRIALVEFVPNEDRISPPMPAAFSLTMLAQTADGDAYTFDELKEMLESAGFSQVTMVQVEDMPQSVILAHR